MSRTYSVYEAKTHFSDLLRKVRAGGRVVITMRGEPIAEIRPAEPPASTLEGRIAELEKRGVITPAADKERQFPILVRRKGALARFLAERD